MANYMEPFVNVGVRLIGGCCGTTPEHIHTMKLFLKVGCSARLILQGGEDHRN